MNITACTSDSGEFRMAFVDEIVADGESFFFVSSKYQPEAQSFSDEELEYYFEQMALKVATTKIQQRPEVYKKYGLTKDDAYQLFYQTLKEWDRASQDLYDVHLNFLLPTDGDHILNAANNMNITNNLDVSIRQKVLDMIVCENPSRDPSEIEIQLCSKYQ